MHKRIMVVLLLAVCAPAVNADVVELSPDLYLVIRMSRIEDAVAIKIGAITEANQFAASTGRVAVPLTGRWSQLGPILRQYEYQFRVMSRDEALAAKPMLADVVVAVDGADTCGNRAAPTVAALLPELSKLAPLEERDLKIAVDRKAKSEESAPPVPVAEPPAPPPTGPSAQ
jgi:hypothetical protein